MTDAELLTEWPATRQRGFWKFVLVRGVSWGAPVAIACLVAKWPKDQAIDLWQIILAFAIFIAAGCVFGPITWWKREAEYKRLLASQTERKSCSR